MAVRRSGARGLVVGLSLAAGCQVVAGIPDELSLGTGSGGTGAAPPDVCVREAVPAAPAAQGVGGDLSFVAALRTINVEKEVNGSLPGLNLDGLCSCTEDKRACMPLDGEDKKGVCDESGGRDNAGHTLFSTFAYLLGLEESSSYYSSLIEEGRWTVLLRVRGYSGTAEDDQVEVAWYVSPGLGATPTWQGTDAWHVTTTSVAPIPEDLHAPLFFDDMAYVTGGKLVARLPAVPLVIAGNNTHLALQLSDARIVARIEKVADDRFRLREGTIGAKLPLPDLFAALSSFRGTSGNPFCTNAPLYPATRQITCEVADVLLGAPEKDTLCEALSFGANFETEAATLGGVYEPQPVSAGCAPELDPATDVCTF